MNKKLSSQEKLDKLARLDELNKPQAPSTFLIGLSMLCVLALGIGGTIFGAISLWEKWQEYTQMGTVGIVTQALVTDHRAYISSRSRSFWVTYQFQAASPDGSPQAITRDEKVTFNTYAFAQVGSPITVVYLPDRPNVVRVQEEYLNYPIEEDTYWLLFIEGAAIAVPFWLEVLLYIAWKRPHDLQALQERGRTTGGTVTGTWVTERVRRSYGRLRGANTFDNGTEVYRTQPQLNDHNTMYYVSYQYQAPGDWGDKTFKNHEAVGQYSFNRLKRGDSVTVRYLPEDPKVSRLEIFSSNLPTPENQVPGISKMPGT